MAEYPWAAGDRLDAPNLNRAVEQDQIDGLVTGEAIDASSVPQAAYVRNADGDIMKAIADADTEVVHGFVGFVGNSQNLADNAAVIVITGGVVSGFSGLTIGSEYYIDASTAGTITATSPSSRARMIGIAISATELLIWHNDMKLAEGSDSVADNFGDVTNTITIGFRPKVIITRIRGTSSTTASEVGGTGMWSEVGGNAWFGFTENPTAGSDWVAEGTYQARDTTSDSDLLIDIRTPTATGFDIFYDRAVATHKTSATVFYIAIG